MDFKWSKKEKEIARKVFDLAQKRDYEKLYEKINSTKVGNPDDVWLLQEYLNEKSKEFEEKYDYRYSVLVLLFCRFINEDLLSIDELDFLSQDKIDFIQKIVVAKNK